MRGADSIHLALCKVVWPHSLAHVSYFARVQQRSWLFELFTLLGCIPIPYILLCGLSDLPFVPCLGCLGDHVRGRLPGLACKPSLLDPCLEPREASSIRWKLNFAQVWSVLASLMRQLTIQANPWDAACKPLQPRPVLQGAMHAGGQMQHASD